MTEPIGWRELTELEIKVGKMPLVFRCVDCKSQNGLHKSTCRNTRRYEVPEDRLPKQSQPAADAPDYRICSLCGAETFFSESNNRWTMNDGSGNNICPAGAGVAPKHIPHTPATKDQLLDFVIGVMSDEEKYGALTCGNTKAPVGWHCTRELGHSGPCAAIEEKEPQPAADAPTFTIVPRRNDDRAD